MLRNKLACGLIISAVSGMGYAQALTFDEATTTQSNIQRAEMQGKLEEAKKKAGGMSPAATVPLAQRGVDEVLSLVSVYGVGDKLKADFVFRGAIITLEPGGETKAAGWSVEKLTQTQAVLVQKVGKHIRRRETVYLSAAAASPTAAPQFPMLPTGAAQMMPGQAPIPGTPAQLPPGAAPQPALQPAPQGSTSPAGSMPPAAPANR